MKWQRWSLKWSLPIFVVIVNGGVFDERCNSGASVWDKELSVVSSSSIHSWFLFTVKGGGELRSEGNFVLSQDNYVTT